MKKHVTITRPFGEIAGLEPKLQDVPLLWQSPNDALETSSALLWLTSIMKSQASLQTHENISIIRFNDMCGMLHQLELMRAEQRSVDHTMMHPVSVPGGTRFEVPTV
jgi:hypothetical protein